MEKGQGIQGGIAVCPAGGGGGGMIEKMRGEERGPSAFTFKSTCGPSPHAFGRTGTPWLGLMRAHKGPLRPVQIIYLEKGV